jgi:hypothetical protein
LTLLFLVRLVFALGEAGGNILGNPFEAVLDEAILGETILDESVFGAALGLRRLPIAKYGRNINPPCFLREYMV